MALTVSRNELVVGLVIRAIGYLDKKGDRIFDANGGAW